MQRFDLKRFRKERNITQKEIARIANYPQGFISAMENGRNATPDAFIKLLSEVYGIADLSSYIFEDKNVAYKERGEMKGKSGGKSSSSSVDQSLVDHIIYMNERLLSQIDERDKTIAELRQTIENLRVELAKQKK